MNKQQIIDYLLQEIEEAARTSGRIMGEHDEEMVQIRIDPAIANAMLQHLNGSNPRNRIDTRSKLYAAQMTEGTWHPNYDPITFESDFGLINGQNRLYAVATSGKSQKFNFVIGAPATARKGFDIGATRSISVTHQLTPEIAAAARTVILLQTARTGPTRDEVLREYQANAKTYDYVTHCCRNRPLTRNAVVAAAFIVALKGANGSATQVERLLQDLTNSAPSSSACKLAKMLESRLPRHAGGGQHNRADICLAILNGIKHDLRGHVPQAFHFSTAGLLRFCPGAKYRSKVDYIDAAKRRAQLMNP